MAVDQPAPLPRAGIGGGERHGTNVPRGLQSPRAGPAAHGRFGRMFGFLPVRDIGVDGIDLLCKVLDLTAEPGDDTHDLPAGYTYLGQFIDHDITFDPTSLLQKVNDPLALVNFRTPRLDLDSVYGAGPAGQPYLYERDPDGVGDVRLAIGENPARSPAGIEYAHDDLPRNAQQRAIIGDPRNDENLIVAQLHLLFIRFHNVVADHIAGLWGLAGTELFSEAQRIVRWHYQWVVAHDFLPTVAGDATVDAVLRPAGAWPRVERRFYGWRDEPFIPVEFSGAAYRFGHSMVRGSYKLQHPDENGVDIMGPPGAAADRHLTGSRRLPKRLEIHWDRFFALPDKPPPQNSRKIDRNVARLLRHLPAAVGSADHDLRRLNLLRARALDLPAGPDVARAMGEEPLSADELKLTGLPTQVITPEQIDMLRRAAPLWYYVLCEAEARADGETLGPVGGRIVAEVLIGLIEADPQSYLRQSPAWTPWLGSEPGRFAMSDLVQIAQTMMTPGLPSGSTRDDV